MQYEYCFLTPIGYIRLGGDGKTITSLELDAAGDVSRRDSREVFRIAEEQITEYFDGKRRVFDLPIRLSGTDFQLDVWSMTRNIPFGSVMSYGDVARLIGRPSACRAVGNAMGANPIPLIVPCHRVVAAHGIGGFGYRLDIKRRLLELEGVRYD